MGAWMKKNELNYSMRHLCIYGKNDLWEMGQMWKPWNIFVTKLQGKRPHWKPRCRGDDIKNRENVCEDCHANAIYLWKWKLLKVSLLTVKVLQNSENTPSTVNKIKCIKRSWSYCCYNCCCIVLHECSVKLLKQK